MLITKQSKVEWFINETVLSFIFWFYLKGQDRLKNNTFKERSGPKWDENNSPARKNVSSV